MRKGILLLLGALLMASAHADDQLHPRARYTLHIGDVLDLSYRLTPEYNQTVTIQPDGYASLNIAGNLHLEGLTLDQAHDLIVQKDSERLNDPELNLILSSFQRPYVVVGGEVLQPGRIDLRENMTAMQAVMMAGGVIGSDAVRHPFEALHPATRAGLLEIAEELQPLALRWGK